MSPRIPSLVLAVAIVGAGCTAAADDFKPSPAVRLRAVKRTVTEGTVIVAGRPDDIYAALTDYTQWTAIFPNLRTVTIRSVTADTAVIETVSHKDKRHTLTFRNDPARRIVRFQERGGRVDATAEITLRPGPRAGFTLVTARLDADVTGAAALFVGDGTVRRKREKKVAGDLAKLRAYFGPAGDAADPTRPPRR
ncbi:MAG TPA: SRPBCC family protein [Kofleriaceae bacterium]|jgi:carbon monoxide dehydrogenase subunit G|nr:SRPBCC family protein [Kofleriaceae bacterium]